jgi:hypothetical protein
LSVSPLATPGPDPASRGLNTGLGVVKITDAAPPDDDELQVLRRRAYGPNAGAISS